MKRFIVTAVIASLISGAAFAQTVSSANVVGYNQVTIPSNQYVLVSLDFVTTNNTINGLFGNLPQGATVAMWGTNQTWNTFAKTRTGWGTPGTNVINIGSGVFIKLPAAPATNIYMAGDVPMAATTVLSTVNGYKIMSYPYPADTTFTNTALAKGAAQGDAVSFWNNSWVTFSRTRTGWGTLTNRLNVGQAIFFKAATNRVVNEVKPYTID